MAYAGYVEAACRTFTAGAAIAQHLRVKLSSGVLAAAGASDWELGTMEEASLAASQAVSVRLRTAPGTIRCVASEAITVGATVYAAASGKVATTGTVIVGTALTAASANGDVIEVLRRGPSDMTSDSGTNNDSFTVDADSSAAKVAIDTNSATGDFTVTIVPPNLTGDVTVTLPAADGTLATLAGTETFTNKTLTSPTLTTPTANGITINNSLALEVATVAAAGSAQGDAGALTGAIVYIVTGADGTKGVVLPAAAAGLMVIVYNSVATNGLKVYPASGDDINDGSADAAVTIEGKTMALFTAVDTGTWAAQYTADS